MIDDHDHIEAIFLTARHGRDAPKIAAAQGTIAAGRGDTREARRWRGISRLLRRTIDGPLPAMPARGR